MTANQTHQTDPGDQAKSLEIDRALEAMLRADAAELRAAYIHNDGFSDAVMERVAQLPAPSSTRTFDRASTLRFVIVTATALIGSVVATFGSGGGNLLIDAVMDLATFTVTPSVLAIGGMLLVASTAAIVTATSAK
jgi:hypothetical protein